MEERRVCRVLLLGPPGCGKTTVLRDAAKQLAG
ncbi:MAG: AAA family ATPase [Christensenellales bacterium]